MMPSNRTRLSANHSSQRVHVSHYQRIGVLGGIPIVVLAFLLLLFWLLGALPSLAQSGEAGAIRYVSPTGAGNICSTANPCALQTAVNLSVAGDEVRVQEGLYASGSPTPTLRIDESITIVGGYDSNWSDPPNPLLNETILDGQNLGRVVEIIGAVAPTLDGFVIRNGVADLGAGIYNPAGTPTIRNSRIHDNAALSGSGFGGGIYDGGGATLINNEIQDNRAFRGAGLYVASGEATIRANDIFSNTASGGSPSSGGGIYVAGGGQALIDANYIYYNQSSDTAGGLNAFIGSTVTARNNMFYANEASNVGGAIFAAGTVTLWNNTLAGNSAGSQGGAIYINAGTSAISNNIIAFNSAPTNDGIHLVGGTANGGYNNLHDDASNVTLQNPVVGDPAFLNLANGNLHISENSAARDAADPATPPEINVDIDGEERPDTPGGDIDVGADEFYPGVPNFIITPVAQTIHVDRNDTAIFAHQIANLGTIEDSYTFTCSNTLGWSGTCPTPVNNLPPGGTAGLQTTLQVPDLPPYTESTLYITGTSTFSPSLQMVAVVNVVVAPLPGVAFTPSYSQALNPTESVTFTHLLTNTGDYTDTFTVELISDPYDWAELLPSNIFQVLLGVGESTEVEVVVTVPADAAAGFANTIEIEASSNYDPSVSATVEDTVIARATTGTRYVTNSGDNFNNNCTQKTNPCQTIEHAVGQASAGDSIYVATGTYLESDININDTIFISGGWNANFTNQGEPTETIVDGEQNARLINIAPGARPGISNLTLRNGLASGPGGAIFVGINAEAALTKLVMIGNQAPRGGAIYVANNGDAVIRQSQFYSNTADIEGGAVYAAGENALTIAQSRFEQNEVTGALALATGDGGAIYINSGLINLVNNLFNENHAVGNGGAVFFQASNGTSTVLNNTVRANEADGDGGGLYNNGANVDVINTIFIANNATSGGAVYHNSAGTTTIEYSDITGNSEPQTVGATLGEGNFDADPLFLDEDYRLSPGSPAVDAGDPDTNLSVDFEDQFRPSDQGHDVGWDELVGCRTMRGDVIYGSIQDAIEAGGVDTLIKVSGICRGVHPIEVNGQTISQTVHLMESVTIQGGWNANFSNLTGEPTYVDPEGRGRGFYVSGDINAVIEQITVINGDATGLGGGPAGQDAGGGIYNNDSDVIYRNISVFTSTATFGGGFYNHTGAPQILYLSDVADNGLSEFRANTAGSGGAIYNNTGAMTIDGAWLHGNSATSGGGLYNNNAAIQVFNTVLAGNSASGNGGGIYHAAGNAVYLHLTFYANSAGGNGGGYYNASGSPAVRSSIFQSNVAASGPAIFSATGSPLVDYNYYHDHSGQAVVGVTPGANSIDSATPPGLVDPAAGNFHLLDTAPAGDKGDPNSPVGADFEGDPRPSDQGFDMGADEIAGCLANLNGTLYGSIQLALADAVDGDTILVSGICRGASEYSNPGSVCADGAGIIRTGIYVTKNVTIQGGWDGDFEEREGYSTLDALGLGRVVYIAPGAEPVIEGFQMINGDVVGNGGGVCIDNALPTIQDNYIHHNAATSGGGIYSSNGAAVLNGNHVYSNTATSGAGLYVVNSQADTPAVHNNFFYFNEAVGNGGGIHHASGSALYWHNTVYRNTAGSGGGFYVAAAPDIRSNIVSENTAGQGGGIFGAAGASPSMDYNDFFGNTGGNFGGSIGSDGPNGLSVNPMLVTPGLTLTYGSPVVDAGDPTITLQTDFEGDIRPSHQGFDIGADEVGGCFARVLSAPNIIYGSAQLAVDAAVNGDTVQIDGTCLGVNTQTLPGPNQVTQNLFVDKSITIDGDWDYVNNDPAVLDAGGAGRVLYVASGNSVTVQNIVLLNGEGDGAGLLNGGGGVFNTGDLTLLEVTVQDSSATLGGGLYNEGTLLLQETSVLTNTASNGAGLFQANGTAIVEEESYFFGNIALTSGGAVYGAAGTLVVNGNRMANNHAVNGGGFYLTGGNADVWNNFVYDNSADQGAGLYNSINARIYHNTFVSNLSTGVGAGIYSGGGSPQIRNNIVHANAGTGLHIAAGSPTSDYNNVVGNAGGNYGGSAVPGPNDISLVPIYEDAAKDNYHLDDDSPGVDMGQILPEVQYDIDGDIRPTNASSDMGADEVSACLIKVGDELFGVLQTAIDYAEANDIYEVRIARGECKGVHQRNGTSQVGYITEDLQITGSLLRDDFSDPGDYYSDEVGTLSTIINAEGQGRVIRVASGAAPLISQVALVGGNALVNGGNGDGGALYNPDDGYPQLQTSFMCQSTATRGGAYYGGPTSNADITGGSTGFCVVAQDFEVIDGDLSFDLVPFTGNTATGNGGALYFDSGALFDIRNHLFDDNSAGGDGGGVYNLGHGRIINGIFYENTAGGSGGGIHTTGELLLYHNTINANVASSGQGGGVFRNGSSNFVVNSTVVVDNEAASGGGGIHASATNATANFNNYYNNSPADLGGGIDGGPDSFSANPQLVLGWLLTRFSPNIDRADPALLEPPLAIDYDAQLDIRPDGYPDHIQPPIPHRSDIGADEYFKNFGCLVEPEDYTETAVPGDVLTYVFTITNSGEPEFINGQEIYTSGYTDTLTISLASQTFDWTTLAVEGQVGDVFTRTLGWMESVQAVLTVTVPVTTTSGTQDVSILECRSGAVPTRTDTGKATTNVGLVGSVIIFPDYVDSALPGDVITYVHTVQNLGNSTETFIVTPNAGPRHASAVLVDENGVPYPQALELVLSPSQTATVRLRVTILGTAMAGDVATPGAVVQAANDPENADAALNRIDIGFTSGTRYVSGVGGTDTTNCTDPNFPCLTIQHAVDQASAGDDILLAAGTFTDVTTRTIGATVYTQTLFIDKSVTIRGGYEVDDGFAVSEPITNAVILSGEDSRRVIFITDGVTVTLSSLFIQNGLADGGPGSAEPLNGAGIYNAGANLTITGTWVLSNSAQYGGGLYHAAGDLAIFSSVFANNSNLPNPDMDLGEGGGAYIASGQALLENNTFVGNQASATPAGQPETETPTGHGGALYLNGGEMTLLNNIFAANEAVFGTAFYVSDAAVITNDYNLFDSDDNASNVPLGANSLVGNPAFIDAFYHIGPTSAAKDKGTNNISIIDGVDFENEARFQGIAVDMGADERTQRAEFIFVPTSYSEVISPGLTITYTHFLTNTGDFTDTYTLTPQAVELPPGGGWDYTVSPLSIPELAPGQGITVTVVVTGATFPGYQHILTITATAASSAGSKQVVDTTRIAQTPGVDIDPSRSGSGLPGQTIQYTHTLTNTGDGVDTFTLSVAEATPPGWNITVVPTTTGIITPGGTLPFTVSVTIPAGTISGTVHTVQILAATSSTPVATDTLTNTTTVLEGFGLAIEPDNAMTAPPGTQITYNHVLTNFASVTDTIDLSATSSEGWLTSYTPGPITLGPAASIPVTVVITIPPDAADNTVDTTVITAISQGDPSAQDSAIDVTTVISGGGGEAGVLIEPDNSGVGMPGETISYNHVVTNTGTAADSFNLTAFSSLGWVTTIEPQTTPQLQPGESVPVTLFLTIPITGSSGKVDVTEVMAVSVNDPAVSDSATDTTTVLLSGDIAVLIEPDNTGTAAAGTVITYTHQVINLGQITETFVITTRSALNWPVIVSPNSVVVAPGLGEIVQVSVLVPNGTTPTVDVTTVTARSVTDPSVFDTATDTTIVPGLFLPIMLKQAAGGPPPTPTATPPPGSTPTSTPPPGSTPTPTPGSCTPTGIDLVVTDLWLEPANPGAGETTNVRVTIKNQGSVSVPYGNNFFLDFYVDRVPAPFDPGDFYWGVQGSWMGAGESRTFHVDWNFTGGTHTLWAQVDTDQNVNECPNENNNGFGPVTINVTAPAEGAPAFTPGPLTTPDLPRQTPTPQPAGENEQALPLTPTPTLTVNDEIETEEGGGEDNGGSDEGTGEPATPPPTPAGPLPILVPSPTPIPVPES